MVRSSVVIKKWLPLSIVGAVISLVSALSLNIPIGKTIMAIALVGVLIFSGFLLRSFGKGEGEEGFGNEKQPK
ncbi:MAG: hypothetical protein DLM72_14595 [Candidatus Nitrosopolaris wilkensis]|nr:MAG: hypothetical protein DLM72_14595 [Candidatus Nitrosopolaris wilkensis]